MGLLVLIRLVVRSVALVHLPKRATRTSLPLRAPVSAPQTPSPTPPFNPQGPETWGTFNYLQPQLPSPLATEWSTGFLLLTEASVPE